MRIEFLFCSQLKHDNLKQRYRRETELRPLAWTLWAKRRVKFNLTPGRNLPRGKWKFCRSVECVVVNFRVWILASLTSFLFVTLFMRVCHRMEFTKNLKSSLSTSRSRTWPYWRSRRRPRWRSQIKRTVSYISDLMRRAVYHDNECLDTWTLWSYLET